MRLTQKGKLKVKKKPITITRELQISLNLINFKVIEYLYCC